MINAIGGAALQRFVYPNYYAEFIYKGFEIQKTEKIMEQRPVEESDDGQKSEMGWQTNGNMTSRNCLEEGQLIVEKYDEDGKLVKKIPPGYLPFGETA